VRTINPKGYDVRFFVIMRPQGYALPHKKKESPMAKSSINFQKASKGGLKHNDRSEDHEPDYLLPPEHRLENEVDRSAMEAEKFINELYGDASEKYQQTFGQRLQSKSYLWEAVINLNKNHTMEDVKRAVKKIEEETGFTAVQIAIHRDEGHINERGVVQYNFHAHVTFFTLDRKTGEQLYRKKLTERQEKEGRLKPMNRNRLSKLQDIVAESLNMERGKRGSKAQRMGHKQYKQAKQQEQAKIKDIQEENKQLRAKLKEQGATREQYAELEKLVRELKEQARAKDLTIAELENRLEAFKTQKPTQDTTLSQKDAQIANLEAENEDLKRKVAREELKVNTLVKKHIKLDAENEELRAENKELKEEVSKLKETVERLKHQLKVWSMKGKEKTIETIDKAKSLFTKSPTLDDFRVTRDKYKRAVVEIRDGNDWRPANEAELNQFDKLNESKAKEEIERKKQMNEERGQKSRGYDIGGR